MAWLLGWSSSAVLVLAAAGAGTCPLLQAACATLMRHDAWPQTVGLPSSNATVVLSSLMTACMGGLPSQALPCGTGPVEWLPCVAAWPPGGQGY